MPTLYYAPGACSLAVHVVLEWIEAPYKAVRVNQHAPEFHSINPAGAVPALRLDNGSILTQADAILHYLARKHPQADLLDNRTIETAAELDRWGCFLTGDLHPAFVPVFSPHRYTTSSEDAALRAVVDAALAMVASKLSLLDQHLAGSEWLTGGKRTILDAYALPMMNWADAKLKAGLASYPALYPFHQKLLADPSVQKIMTVEADQEA